MTTAQEIKKRRKELEAKLEKELDFTKGVLQTVSVSVMEELKQLQKQCKHIYDNHKSAIVDEECQICKLYLGGE